MRMRMSPCNGCPLRHLLGPSKQGSACPEHLGRRIPSMHARWILPSIAPWFLRWDSGGTPNDPGETPRSESSTCRWGWCLPDCLLEILWQTLQGFFFFRFGVSFFHVHLSNQSNPILCRSNDFSRFVQAHERAQAGKCPNTIQATMGSLAMLEKPRCGHRSMDAGSPAGHPWVIGSAQKPRILWANWVREWWTQLDSCFFTDVLIRDSPIAPTVDRITPN